MRSLAQAGLDSAQVSIEGGSAEVHDAITQHPGAWEQAVRGVKNLRAEKIHTHTNTTICGGNRDHLIELVDFIADDLKSEYFSMNMVIPTGSAEGANRDLWLRYRDIGRIVEAVRRRARELGIEFLWYSPTPYCLYNPVAHGLGNKGCAACDGLLSVSPTGDVLPCSSIPVSVGNLLEKGFRRVWNGRRARYYRNKRFAPRKCRSCGKFDICTGACPIYWQALGYEELREASPLSGRAGAADASFHRG